MVTQWMSAKENCLKLLPPEHLAAGHLYPTDYQGAFDKAREIHPAKSIGSIAKPADFAEKAEEFRSSNPSFMNRFNYSAEGLSEAIKALPNSYDMDAFFFAGTGNKKDLTLVIVGGIHGNETSTVNSALWMVDRLAEDGDLAFFRKHFQKIVVIPRYSPYGCALGMRLGIEGKNPTLNSLKEQGCAEKKMLNDFLETLTGEKAIVDFHEKNKNDKTAILIIGGMTAVTFNELTVEWAQTMKKTGFAPADQEEFNIATYKHGVFFIKSLTPESIGLDCRLKISVEGGAQEFRRRIAEHHLATVAFCQIITSLRKEGKL